MEKAKKDLDYPKENERIEPQERVSMCFLAKRMWLLQNTCQVVYTQKHHLSKQGVFVHGIGQLGQSVAVGALSLRNTIHWIAKNI